MIDELEMKSGRTQALDSGKASTAVG